jgi:hypothetical protein
MRPLLLFAATLAGALTLGCEDQPTPGEPTRTLPSFRTGQNPEGPGAFVIRGPEFGFFTSDPAEAGFPPPNLTLHIGSPFEDLLDLCATGEPTLTPIERLLVFRPNGTPELPDLQTIVHGAKLTLLVWETAIPFIDPFAELCNLALNVPHLEGTGQFMATDNDVFVTGKRADAFHTGIHGQVTSETGQRFRVTDQFHGQVLPSGEFRFTFDIDMEPIGH